jgi:hypothetical protein
MIITKKEAEGSILKEMLERHAERCKTGDMTDNWIVPAANIEEIRKRIERASILSPSSMYRVGQRFLKETDPKLK